MTEQLTPFVVTRQAIAEAPVQLDPPDDSRPWEVVKVAVARDGALLVVWRPLRIADLGPEVAFDDDLEDAAAGDEPVDD